MKIPFARKYEQATFIHWIVPIALFLVAIGFSVYFGTAFALNTWTEHRPPGLNDWAGLAASTDGTKIVGALSAGDVYTSTDSGASWVKHTLTNAANISRVTSISISGDGAKIAVAGLTNSSGQPPFVEISTDGGSTWADRTSIISPPNPLIFQDPPQVVEAEDGSAFVVAVLGGDIYTSTNDGVSWTDRASAGIRYWNGLSTQDGVHIAAAVSGGFGNFGDIYTSSNGGTTWTDQTTAGTRGWNGVTISSDGTKLVGVVSTGYIYTSANGGTTWATSTAAGSHNWQYLSASRDGTKLAVSTGDGTADIYTSTDSGATWVDRLSDANNRSNSTAVSYDGSTVVAANGDISVSINAGANWTLAPEVEAYHEWKGIAGSSDGTKLVAIEHNGYLYTSTDSGTTWTQHKGPGIQDWLSVTSSADGTRLAAGTDGTDIWTSSDSGATWTDRSSAGVGIWQSITSSADGSKLAAVDNQPGGDVHTSTDGGVTWTNHTSATGGINWGTVTATSDGVHIAAIAFGDNFNNSTVVISNDGGATWSVSSAGLHEWSSVAYSADGSILIAADDRNGDLHVSSDFGADWIDEVSAGARIWISVAASADGGVLVADSIINGKIYTSTDDGTTWTAQNAAGIRNWEALAISADGTHIAATPATSNQLGYIYISSDSGTTWATSTDAGSRNWTSITLSSDGQKIVASDRGNNIDNGDIYTSADGGVTWTKQSATDNLNWLNVTSSSDGSILYAAANEHGGGTMDIWKSTDSGVSWTKLPEAHDRAWWASIFTTSDGQILLASVGLGARGSIWQSTDAGTTFTTRMTPARLQWTAIAGSSDGTKLFAVEDGPGQGSYKGDTWTSSDGGATWTGRIAPTGAQFWGPAAASADLTKLLAATNYPDVWTSSDSGVTWTERSSMAPETWQSAAYSADGSTLAIGSSGDSIWRSTDAGVSWTAETAPGSQVWNGLFLSSDGSFLAADEESEGSIWTLGDAGATSPSGGGGGSTANYTGGGGGGSSYPANSPTATTTATTATTTATTTIQTVVAISATTTTATTTLTTPAATTTPLVVVAVKPPVVAPTGCVVRSAQEWAVTLKWPYPALTVGRQTYKQTQLLPILQTESTNPSMILAKQVIAAMLNYEEGATPAPDLAAAKKWMEDNDTNPADGLNYSVLSDTAKTAGLALAARLETYNASGKTCELKPGATSLTLSCDAPNTFSTSSPQLPAYLSQGSRNIIVANGLLQNLSGALALPVQNTEDTLVSRAITFITQHKALFGIGRTASVIDAMRVDQTVVQPDTMLPPPTATIDAGAGNGVTAVVPIGAQVTIHATFSVGRFNSLLATAINNDNDGARSMSCSDGMSGPNCWTLPDPSKTFTFTPTEAGTTTFSAQIKTNYFVPALCKRDFLSGDINCYDSYATVSVIAIATTTATTTPLTNILCTDNSCGVPCQDGYSLDSQSGICTHNFLPSTAAVTAAQAISRKNVVFTRYIQGLPVFGSSVSMSLAGATSSPGAVIKSILTNLPANDTISNAVLLTPEQAIAKALASTSATLATTTLVVFNAGMMRDNQCQTSNRIVYQVTLLDPGPNDPAMRFIDPGHGGILFETGGSVEAQNILTVARTSSEIGAPQTVVAQDQPLCNPDKGSPICVAPDQYLLAQRLYYLASDGYKFFLAKFNRDMPDGAGGLLSTKYDTAVAPEDIQGPHFSWGGVDRQELVVDNKNVFFDPDALYVIIHEMGHAVLYNSGIYATGGSHTEAESIHEGMADLFAFYAKGAWQLLLPNGGKRDAVPTLDWSAGNDPHVSGLRLGHVAYTAGNGGSGTDENGDAVTVTPGPGENNAVAQIFYDTIYTRKISGFPNWDRFSQATIDDAQDASDVDDPHDLNGQVIDPHDCAAVLNGWAAVKYGEGDRDNDCVPNLEDDCPDIYDPKQDAECCPKFLDQLKKSGASIDMSQCDKKGDTVPANASSTGEWVTYSGTVAPTDVLDMWLGFEVQNIVCRFHKDPTFTGTFPDWSCKYWWLPTDPPVPTPNILNG
jgi:hypothetical protein